MGLFDRINRAWSGADWWDKKENQKQRQQFAAQDKRKKRLEEEQARTQAPNIAVQRPQDNITPDKPAFDFTRLKTPTNKVQVPQLQEYDAQALDNVGVKKPQQSLLNKVRDQVDANTEADKYRRAREQTQKVTKDLTARGIQQDKAQQTAAKLAKSNMNTPVRTGIDNVKDFGKDFTGNTAKMAKDMVFQPLKTITSVPVEAGRSSLADFTGNKEARRAAEYRINENLFGKENADRAEREGKISGWAALGGAANAIGAFPVVGGLGLLAKGAKEATVTKTLQPLIKGGVAGLDEALLGVRNAFKRPQVAKDLNQLEKDALEAATASKASSGSKDIGNLLSDADIADITAPTNIPVRRPNPINVVDEGSDVVNVPVRNTTPEGPIIREIGGDAPNVTQMPTPQQAAEQKALDEFANQPFGRPDDRIEGVTPRPDQTFQMDEVAVQKTKDEITQDYAGMLRGFGEGNGVDIVNGRRVSNNFRSADNKGKRMTKADWEEEAARQLRDGRAPEEIQRAFNESGDPDIQSLLNRGEQPDVPVGRPIEVKKVDSIPVQDRTVVPTDTPQVPGTVRVSTQKSPVAEKTQAVADQPPVKAPKGVVDGDGGRYMKDGGYVAPDGRTFDANGSYKGQVKTMYEPQAETPSAKLPKVGSTMPDGKVVTQRMVDSQRKQRTMSNKLVKAQQQKADNMEIINGTDNPNNALDSRQPGLILSDELKKGKKGVYQVAKQEDQVSEVGTKSVGQIIQEADESVRTNGTLNDRDIANVSDALFGGNVKAGTPEYKRLSDLYYSEGTREGQRFNFRKQTSHRTASGTEISNRTISKLTALADDPSKITSKHIEDVQRTADEYAEVRDASTKAADDFNANPTKENYDRFIQLNKDVVKAEKSMATTQYNAAKSALKGNTNVKLKRELEDAAEQADLYTMDFVDSALLSGTGTFVRNFVNASLGSLEEGVFGGIGARVGRAVKKTPVGGGIGKGSLSGFGKGASNIVDASKARFSNAGWNPIEHMKNWSTTGNQLGDSMIEGSIGRSVRNHYQQVLKKQGYKGDELNMRADVMARQDPENLADSIYAPQARKDAGLGSGVSKRSSWEKNAQREIADGIAKVIGKEYSQGGENFAKTVTRIVMGFPSAVGRSLVAGSQRIVPLANVDTFKVFTAESPTLRAAAIKESIKKSGTAATAATIFYGLGANGNITGAYPKDPNERAAWEREGKRENAIRIGDAWYDAPSYLSSFGLPVLVWASLGRNGGVNAKSLKDIRGIVSAMSPTNNIDDINKMLDGRLDFGKYTQNVAASAGRMATPYGSLLNQISRAMDPNQNDTSSDSWIGGLFNKLIDGVPVLDNKILPDKKDADGNVLKNPNALETMLGAAGAAQNKGEERSAEINQKIDDTVKTIKDTGAFDDPNLKDVLEGDAVGLYNRASKGDKLDESEIKALKKALTKGVSSSGEDTAYLEKGQYDTNLTVLKLKRELMAADKTTKPSSLKDIDLAITRGGIYKDNEVPYDMINEYKETSQQDWRNMGNPEHDDYDPDMYQKLWDIDKLMTDKKVSYRKGDPEKAKFKAEEAGKGKGKGKGSGSGRRGGSGSGGTEFGTIKDMGPRVKEYDSMAMSGGNVPVIGVKRPNIIHKITSSR